MVISSSYVAIIIFRIFEERNRFISKLNLNHVKSREQISEIFTNLRYETNKKRFVRFLKDNKKENPEGDWPDHEIFKSKKDSNIYLAILEEQWLGLNR